MNESTIRALDIARMLARAGVPIFVARAIPGRPGEFRRPEGWQRTAPDPTIVDTWQPGDALCAVGGGPADWLDCDAYNGGAQSRDELIMGGAWPTSYGQQETPSGGTHDIIVPLRVGSKDGWAHGLDLKGGRADGQGRGYIYIEPTMKPRKSDGKLAGYHWVVEPDMALLAECADTDDSGQAIAARIGVRDERAPVASASVEGDPFASPSHPFTVAEAIAFCKPAMDALKVAPNGTIRARLSDAALVLGRFREVWSAEDRTRFLLTALESTEYDGATWKAEPCIEGCFDSPKLDWQATLVPDFTDPTTVVATAEPDAVQRLRAELLDVDALFALPPPVPLIRDVLDLDSESWIIAEAGGFKSFVALDMACHICVGRAWRGQAVTRGAVVYVAAEGKKGIGKRVKAWAQMNDIKPTDLWVLPRPVQVRDMAGWATLIELCRQIKPVLIVLDTQARITVGLEENSNGDMGQLTEAVRRLKEATGACVLVVHHLGRGGDNARGASAIDGAQDTELKVVRPVGATRSDLTCVVKMDKQKDSAEDADFDLQLRVVDLGFADDGRRLTSLAVEPMSTDPFGPVKKKREGDWLENLTENWQDVVRALREITDERGVTQAQLREFTTAWRKQHTRRGELTKASANRAIKALMERELLEYRPKSTTHYILTDDGRGVAERIGDGDSG